MNLKFDRAGEVKLNMAENWRGSFQTDQWCIREDKADQPNAHEFSVLVSRVEGTSAGRESDPETAESLARAAKEKKRPACSLTMMAQRLLNPNPTAAEDPAMSCTREKDGRWMCFELQLELELNIDPVPGSGTTEKRNSRSSSEKEQRKEKNSKRLSASSDEYERGSGKRGETGKTLLERVDEAVTSEVVVKYLESGKDLLPVPQEKQVRFHDMVWMESDKDVAWTVPHGPRVQSTEEPQMEDNFASLSSATQGQRLENITQFFQIPNTGWTCPPSSVVGSGTMHWKQREEKSFSYVRVSRLGGVGSVDGGGSVNPHLLRFYIERVWGLKRPKLFVSVTGAAKDFDLADAPKEKLLKGLQELGKIEGVWMATGGCSEGIMQFVGLARALMEVPVPLIGFATWGCIRGRGSLVSPPGTVLDEPITGGGYKDVVTANEQLYAKANVELDENHSHFVLVSDGTADDFGKEFDVRAQLESVVAGTESRSDEILAMLKELKMGWKDMVCQAEEKLKANSNDSIPLVLICVQGGPGTIGTCLAACKENVPLLLVKGSGKAADVIADAVLLKFKSGHVKYVPEDSMSKEMKGLLEYLKDFCSFQEHVQCHTAEHCVDYSEIIDALQARRQGKEDQQEEHRVNDIFKAYWGGERGLDDPLSTMSKILQIANKSNCWVFDLNDQDPGGIDFSGSLLRCIINTQGYEDEGVDKKAERTQPVHLGVDMTLAASILYDKLMLAVHWDRQDIVELVLKNTRMRRSKNQDFLQAVNMALHRAILLNKVSVVRALLEHGASIEQYQLTADLRNWDVHLLDEPESPENKALKKSYKAAELWFGLLRSYKVDKKTRHVFAFITAWQPANRSTSSRKREHGEAMAFDSNDSIPAKARGGAISFARGASSFVLKRSQSFKVDVEKRKDMSDMEWFGDLQKEGRFYKDRGGEESLRHVETVKTRKTIPKLNELLGHVMGHDFHYQIGLKATALHDLFLWACLTNRVHLAMVFWEKYNKPVNSALTACVLLRMMAKRTEVDPVMRDKMEKSAAHFETLAIGVQKAAQDLDLSQALEMLECPTIVWDRITCLDIAIKGRCEQFIESCARSALDRRFAGDLEPYGQHLGPLQGFKRVVLVCFLTGGFIAPWVIKFALPPKAHCLRHPTQHRVMPEGYPYQPQKNKILLRQQKQLEESDSNKAVRWLRLFREATSGRDGLEQKIGEEQLKELWHPTFSYWERLWCFWKSPVVLYMANATVQVLIAVTETYFLTTHFVSDPANRADIQYLEWVWLAYSIASSAEELVHAIVDGFRSYCTDIWNAVDSFAALFFWIGFGVRMSCWNHGSACIHSTEQDLVFVRFKEGVASREEMAVQCYSVSLFCLWVRLLRILSADRKLGPLVLILRSMVADTLNFGVMWVMLWMAFSVFIFGSGINNDVNNNACEESEFPGACSSGWWVIRTYFQAMGEPIIEEMSTMSSVIILMMLWVMMNLVLVNLLIAMMSNTYQAIERKSERQWMIDLYQLVKEASRFALTVPAPFNLLWIMNEIWFFVQHLNEGKLDRLYGERTSWRLKLRLHISRNMSTQRMLEERDCVSQEEKERQKLGSFMERARIKWREGKAASAVMQDRLGGMELRLYEMKIQMAKLYDRMVVNPHDTYNFNRRGSRASIADSSSSMDLLYNRAQTPLQPTSLGSTGSPTFGPVI